MHHIFKELKEQRSEDAAQLFISYCCLCEPHGHGYIFQERTLFKEERLYTLEVQISIWSFRALHRNVNEHRCVDFHWPDL